MSGCGDSCIGKVGLEGGMEYGVGDGVVNLRVCGTKGENVGLGSAGDGSVGGWVLVGGIAASRWLSCESVGISGDLLNLVVRCGGMWAGAVAVAMGGFGRTVSVGGSVGSGSGTAGAGG